jgi:hypothetical protein
LTGVFREEFYVSNDTIRGAYYLFSRFKEAECRPLAFSFDLKIDSLTREVRMVDERDEITLPRDFLKKIKVMDMDNVLERIKTCEDSEEFYESMKGKVVWGIDRGTMTDSTVTLVKTEAAMIQCVS